MSTKDELKAGRELDALVLEKVFGYEHRIEKDEVSDGSFMGFSLWWKTEGDWFQEDDLPKYSTGLLDAWEVVVLMKFSIIPIEDGYFVGHYDVESEYFDIEQGVIDGHFSSNSSGFAVAPTAPLAICRAALKAVERRARRRVHLST